MFVLLLCLLALQRTTEVIISWRNQKWLRAHGAVEHGRGHYPIIVVLHVLFYASLILERRFLIRGWDPFWPVWLGLLLSAQILRIWAMASLGRFWNTRILVVRGAKAVVAGPYRYIRHPNYVAVAVEVLMIPMLCGAYITATAFSILNIVVLRTRIREEEKALRTLSAWEPGWLPRFVPLLRRKESSG